MAEPMDKASPTKEDMPVSKDALGSDEDFADLIEFALNSTSGTYVVQSIGDLLEKYGTKLSLLGRAVSAIGDSLTGLGRWLQQYEGDNLSSLLPTVRSALVNQALTLRHQAKSADLEERLALHLVAGVFDQVAGDSKIPDDQIEKSLVRRLYDVSKRLLGVYAGPDVEEEVDEEQQRRIVQHVLEKVTTKPEIERL